MNYRDELGAVITGLWPLGDDADIWNLIFEYLNLIDEGGERGGRDRESIRLIGLLAEDVGAGTI